MLYGEIPGPSGLEAIATAESWLPHKACIKNKKTPLYSLEAWISGYSGAALICAYRASMSLLWCLYGQ